MIQVKIDRLGEYAFNSVCESLNEIDEDQKNWYVNTCECVHIVAADMAIVTQYLKRVEDLGIDLFGGE